MSIQDDNLTCIYTVGFTILNIQLPKLIAL